MEISKEAFLHPVPLNKIHDVASSRDLPFSLERSAAATIFFGSDLPWEKGSESQPMPTRAGGAHRRERESAGAL